MKRKFWFGVLAVGLIFSLGTGVGRAALVNLGPGSFTPEATVITFSEYILGTQNPSYSFTGLPNLGDVTVNFGGFFVGQSQVGNTLSDHTPDNPLALDSASPYTFITSDGANPTSPVLSGYPRFAGTIAILFSVPVAGVGLDGGYFDALNSTTIEAYDANGNILGSITNSQYGIEFFGLADSSGQNVIKGISFYITGDEPAGYAIDNLTFGAAQVIRTPEPGILLLLGAGILGLLGIRRKR